MTDRKHISLIALAILTSINLWAQLPDSNVYHQLSEFPFVFVSDDDVTTPPVISDSLFDAASRGIRFKVNRTLWLHLCAWTPISR